MNLALQQGWCDLWPAWIVRLFLVVPILIFTFAAATHENVRRFIARNHMLSLGLFIICFAITGAAVWFTLFKIGPKSQTLTDISVQWKGVTRDNITEQVSSPRETVKAVRSKLSRLPRLSMFVDGKLKDSQTWDMIEEIRTLFHDTGHQAENGRLTDGEPARGAIAIYLMENPPAELVDALTLICNGFGREATFSKTLHGNDVQILIGPPPRPVPPGPRAYAGTSDSSRIYVAGTNVLEF